MMDRSSIHAWARAWGWSEHFDQAIKEFTPTTNWKPGRVVEEQKGHFRLISEKGELWSEPSGKLRRDSRREAEVETLWPSVGDWVLADFTSGSGARLEHVLPRRTKLSRAAAGTGVTEQVIAANVDVAFILTSLNQELNPRRLDRYLLAVSQSGAEAVILLSKADLVEDTSDRIAALTLAAPGISIRPISSFRNDSLGVLAEWLQPGRTVVLLGSSGVGKSTLVNALAGEEWMTTGSVRESDARGRHTTTFRRLFQLPSRALLIDTPGIRELQNWENESAEEALGAFGDLALLAASCKFSNCRHASEPGCTVRPALESGTVSLERWENFLKLSREAEFQIQKRDNAAQSRLKGEVRKMTRDMRRYQKAKRGLLE